MLIFLFLQDAGASVTAGGHFKIVEEVCGVKASKPMAQLFETPRQYISHVFAHDIPLSMQFLRLEDDRCRLSPLYTKDLCFFKEIGTNDCMLP